MADVRGHPKSLDEVHVSVGNWATDLEGGSRFGYSLLWVVTLIHVSDSAPSHVYDTDIYDEHTRDDERYLDEIAEEVRGLGVSVEIALLHGDPVTQLADFAQAQRLDMLVMGSHGHRLLGDLLFGETVDPVRHRIEIPVLVAR
jgi:manganese transport protein